MANAVTMAAERREGLAGVNSPDEHRGARGCLAGGEEGTVGGREGDARERLRAALSVGGEGRVAAGTRLDDAGCAGRGARSVVAGASSPGSYTTTVAPDGNATTPEFGATARAPSSSTDRARAVPAAGRRRVCL